jgi:hypothetical protein
MSLLFRYYLLSLALLVLTACVTRATPTEVPTAKPRSAPDPDAISLIAMSGPANQIAQKESSDVVLRQVDTDLTITDFRFVDRALTWETMVVIPGPDAPIDKWYTVVNSVSPLLTRAGPALNLQGLRIGPNAVAQAITAHWPGCTVRGLTLYLENDKLTWLAFCKTFEGVVSGTMQDQTGVFQPSNAPPAPVPSTATPIP